MTKCLEIDALGGGRLKCRLFVFDLCVTAGMILEHSHKVVEPRGHDNFQKTLILMQLVNSLSLTGKGVLGLSCLTECYHNDYIFSLRFSIACCVYFDSGS